MVRCRIRPVKGGLRNEDMQLRTRPGQRVGPIPLHIDRLDEINRPTVVRLTVKDLSGEIILENPVQTTVHK